MLISERGLTHFFEILGGGAKDPEIHTLPERIPAHRAIPALVQ